MKQVLTFIQSNWVFGGADRYCKDSDIGERYLKLQVEHSLRLGWKKEDIIIGTNFPFDFMGVKSYPIELKNDWSSFANKMPSLVHLIDTLKLNDDLWVRDCDTFQLILFDFPKEVIDVGYIRHSTPARNKPQGGCVFIRPSGYDVIRTLAKEITEKKVKKEESYMISFYARPELIERRTWLNYRYNLFRRSDFKRKYHLATKPIYVVHFHPEYRSTWDCFVEGKNCFNKKIITPEIKELLIKYDLTPKIER